MRTNANREARTKNSDFDHKPRRKRARKNTLRDFRDTRLDKRSANENDRTEDK